MDQEKDEEIYEQLPTEAEINDIKSVIEREKMSAPDVDAEWEKISRGMDHDNHRTLYIGIILSIAASLMLFFIITFDNGTKSPNEVMSYKDDNKADITITTDEQGTQTMKQSSVSFANARKTAAIVSSELVSMNTPRGKDCHITLPDGTRVWLNAESSIQFPRTFAGSQREVHLTGEAFFDVTKDRKHPFIVHTEYFSTTVLGTSFNVRAYSEKDASLVLVNGSVLAESPDHGFVQRLVPGQKMQYLSSDKVVMSTIDTYPFTQRKDGLFYFANDNLLNIMVEIGRWYNKTVVFENLQSMNIKLHFVAERSQSLSTIIESLNDMDGVEIELGNNEITIH